MRREERVDEDYQGPWRGLLVGKSGLEGNVFRVAPALNVGRSDIEEALAIIRESFEAAGAR